MFKSKNKTTSLLSAERLIGIEVLISLPIINHHDYNRHFKVGTLIDFCFKKCCHCEGRVYLSLRHRKVQNIYYYKGRCAGNCRTHFAFLPQFVYYRKWYSTTKISESIEFIQEQRFSSVSEALSSWEINRENNISDGLPAGPCRTTVYNWYRQRQDRIDSSSSSGDQGFSDSNNKSPVKPIIAARKLPSPVLSSSLPSIANTSSLVGLTHTILDVVGICNFLILIILYLFSVTINNFILAFCVSNECRKLCLKAACNRVVSAIAKACPEVEYIFSPPSYKIVFTGIPP